MDTIGFLNKAADKMGFERICREEKQIPTDSNRIVVVPFFGDIRSTVILAGLLLRRFKEEERPSKYLILVSWKGFEALFPYVDEYWGFEDASLMEKMYLKTEGFCNKSEKYFEIFRNLNQYFFEDMVQDDYFKKYYEHGIAKDFWEKYKEVKIHLPQIQSSISLDRDFLKELNRNTGLKLFVYPSKFFNTWNHNKLQFTEASKTFWVSLIERLLKEGITPVLCRSSLTHDLSKEFVEKCIYYTYEDLGHLLSVMRNVGCVLDVFNGISRLAISARCPFFAVDERMRYVGLKEYEIDDLFAWNLPRQYIFSFSTIIEGGILADSLISKVKEFLLSLDRETFPSAGEFYGVVPYDHVRRRKSKMMGTRLLKMPKNKE